MKGVTEMTQQVMDFDRVPAPEPEAESCDLSALIKKEHQRAELQRLDEGWPGCGCLACQELYKTLDLSKYGSRVKRHGAVIAISEQPGGGGNFTDSTGEVVTYIDGIAYGILPNGKTFRMGLEAVVKAVIADPELCYDIPAWDKIIELERKLGVKIIKKEGDNKDARAFRAANKHRISQRGLQRTQSAGHAANKLRGFTKTPPGRAARRQPKQNDKSLPSKRSLGVAETK